MKTCTRLMRDGDCGRNAAIHVQWTHNLRGEPIDPNAHTTEWYLCRKHETDVFAFASNCKLTITIL